ncbi:hypothetical protein C0989_012124 [Termitomyces sp. Mn162]|nr:hypothetical protein C0989_012124 [Termitomyces sp. Mn162]
MDLALVSRIFRRVLDVILYRTVVLDSTETLQLFHRTIQLKRPTFFADHVLRIVVTDYNVASHRYLNDIIAACSGLRSLVIPSYKWSQIFLTESPPLDKSLQSITLRSFDPSNITNQRSSRLPAMGFSNLTHLRICEPADVWCSPTTIVEAFGPLPHLSHLQFARRANANQGNDERFALSISSLLATRSSLKMLVVGIFPAAFPTSNDAPVQESEIWHLMRELCCSDRRLILAPGRYEEWKDGWNEICAVRSRWRPIDY